MIVGRKLESTFPPKHDASRDDPVNFRINKFGGPGFIDVSAEARRGDIIGIAGVVGNGQSDVLRALAGLEPLRRQRRDRGTNFYARRTCCRTPPSCRPIVTVRAS